MKKNTMFWIFGILQAAALGLIIFFILTGLNTIQKTTSIMLSILFPIFLLVIEYMIYSRD